MVAGLRWLDRLRRDERGQAMPLAAVGIFAMVLGVLATLNLGQAVHEKIRLQNTADSAAYSLAAMEARTFNYIAFLNRVQIAHYNTAMVVQSYMTWVGFHVAVFGQTVDILSTLRNAVEMGSRVTLICNYGGPRCYYSMLNGFINPIASAYEQIRDLLLQINTQLDKIGHWIVEAMSIFNRAAVWQTQMARAVLLNGHLLSGMVSYVHNMDPDVSYTSGAGVAVNFLLNSALNSIEYYQTFDNASGVNPFAFSVIQDYTRRARAPGGKYADPTQLDEPAKDAYRIMTELCHGTRTPQFVSNRGSPNASFNQTLPLAAMWMPTVQGQKQGQTKFTTDGEMNGAEIRAIGSEGNYEVGTYLSSDDFAQQVTGSAFAVLSSAFATVTWTGNNKLGDAIAAYDTDGAHYRYKGPSSTTNNRISTDGRNVTVVGNGMISPVMQTANYDSTENHAPWPGFAPFFKFKPSSDRTRDFNQPSTWMFLNKHHRDFQTDSGSHAQDTRAPWYSNFSWQNGADVARLNTAVGGSGNSYLFQGINVISRGMAYYHRPGHWKEHPNFFNPYWRARLAPVGQKLQAFWDRYVTQNISTSSDSQVIQSMVAVLRGAQMDLMTSAITSIITH